MPTPSTYTDAAAYHGGVFVGTADSCFFHSAPSKPMTIEKTQTPAGGALVELLPRLMGFARLIQSLANRFKGLARNLALTGLGSALLLDWLATRSWGLSVTWAVVLGVILLAPGLILGWSWYVLEEAGNLPQRITQWASQAKNFAGDMVQRLQAEKPAAGSKGRLTDLKGLGGLTYEIASMGIDATDLLGILGGTLSFTNPIFLLVLTISAGLIIMLDITAVIAGLAALF